MTNLLRAAALAALVASPAVAPAQPSYRAAPAQGLSDPFGPTGGQAPWSRPWEYDTGGDNDKRPELSRFQQGGGQQTGGPARNLIPRDNLHIVPR